MATLEDYDENGNMILMATSSDDDGPPPPPPPPPPDLGDLNDLDTSKYDENGNLIKSNGDKPPTPPPPMEINENGVSNREIDTEKHKHDAPLPPVPKPIEIKDKDATNIKPNAIVPKKSGKIGTRGNKAMAIPEARKAELKGLEMNAKEIDQEITEGPAIEGTGKKHDEGFVEKTKLVNRNEIKKLKQRSYFTDTVDQPMKFQIKALNIARPDLDRVPFRIDDIPLALVTRGHNSIRYHINNLIEILDYMRTNPRDIGSYDIAQCFQWWDHFASFLSEHFEAEQATIIIPTNKRKKLPDALGSDRRKLVAETLRQYLATCNKARKNHTNRPPFEPLEKLISALPNLNAFLEYSHDLDKLLPTIIRNNFNEKEVNEMEREYCKQLGSSGDEKNLHLLLLIEGIEPDEIKYVKKSVLTLNQKFWMGSYKKMYIATHVSVIRYFQNQKISARKKIEQAKKQSPDTSQPNTI